MRQNPKHPLALLSTAALAAVLLAGCGNTTGSDAEDDGAVGGPGGVPSSVAASESAEASNTASSSASSAAAEGGADPALEAVGTATAEGGQVIKLDREDGGEGYDVTVLNGDTAQEVRVGPDGKIASTEQEKVDDKDRTEAAGATADLTTVLEAAIAKGDGRMVDEAELEEEEGKVQWKVTLDRDNQDEIEVRVDAATGQVVP